MAGLDTGGLPGITTVQMCTDPRVAFVSFESESSAAISRAPIESKISELLSQYADNEQTKGDWRLLNGKRWMVFGEASKMTALQQQWAANLRQSPQPQIPQTAVTPDRLPVSLEKSQGDSARITQCD